MGEWRTNEYKLNELGNVSRGRSRYRPRDDESLYGGKYPFVQTGDIKSANFYLTNYTQTYNKKGLAQSKLWLKGTLCITIAANIAETAILDIDACFPDSIVGFVPYEGIADVRYVKYYFDIYKKQMQAMSLGAAQDNFSVDKMLKVKFILPDFGIQTRIADILSVYDNAIENNNRRIALLEKAARELYCEWFVRMRFPGYRDAKIANGLPEGWEL
ncbi:MAG: restriction endonuclease subunit S [Defluviitaleaceae bacterium]|nr:restriction endonuclease subunit S [Defluviitaleaceae bacterium]